MVLVSLIISILALAASLLFYLKARRTQKISSEKLSNRVSSLLTEFNEVSSDKVNMLEDKTDELRRVVELADLKIDRLNQLVDHATGARKKLEQDLEASGGSESGKSRREKVLALAEQGFSVEEIARKLDLKRGEVDVIVKFNRSRFAEK